MERIEVSHAKSIAERSVCLGVIAGAHGVRGQVRVESFTARPEDVAAYGALRDEAGVRSFELALVGKAKGALLARIAGVVDRDAAEALRGTRLYVSRARLPAPAAGEFYLADLVGLRCETPDDRAFGTVAAFHNFGAGDVIEIERPSGERELLPFNSTVVPLVDPAAGRLVIEPPAESPAEPEEMQRHEAAP